MIITYANVFLFVLMSKKSVITLKVCLLGRFPSGETSQRTDVIDAELYVFLAEGRNVRFESAAHFELWHQVFPDVQDYVCIAHHHQTGSYDMQTFEIHARPVQAVEGLRPGMSAIVNKV